MTNMKNEETVIFDDVSLNEEKLTIGPLEYLQRRLMDFSHLPGQH